MESSYFALVGFPPCPLIAEEATPLVNVLRNEEVVLIKIRDNSLAPSNADTGIARQIHSSSRPPRIDDETWENLDEETKRELSFNIFEYEDEDEELDNESEESI